MSIITLTTDFGTGSPYVAEMKGVILAINPAATLVDVSHQVPPQDVRGGALVLAGVAERFPPDTIHAAVVDPGVGTDRAIVYARIGQQSFVAPDNGLLSNLSRRTWPSKIVRLTEPEFWSAQVSTTFHGRDVIAPVAARLSLGLDPDRLGPRSERLVELDWPQAKITPGKITGEIFDVDSFGNLITNITTEMLDQVPAGVSIHVACEDCQIEGIAQAYAARPPSQWIALVGSGGRMELALVNGNAAAELGVPIGTPVIVTWRQSAVTHDR